MPRYAIAVLMLLLVPHNKTPHTERFIRNLLGFAEVPSPWLLLVLTFLHHLTLTQSPHPIHHSPTFLLLLLPPRPSYSSLWLPSYQLHEQQHQEHHFHCQ